LRLIDSRWSLPPDVTGTVSITIGDWKKSFEIDGNTSDSVNAEVAKDVIPDLFARMDKASTMFVTVGKAKPFQVSLAGSTKATNAFLTCAGIKGHSQVPGSNPFE